MKYLFLNEVISEKITGDWGDEGDKVNVLRTTNFTNDGVIDYFNVVTRDIPEKVIERKKLVQGDVIIEKSGGSPSQPVGRVVYFDRKDEVFLCNNFTAILRSNDLVFPKYLFYFLFSLHKLGITLKFQNKTTGIINLQLDKYLDRIQIPIPPLPEQKRIAEILDKADALRQKNKQLLAAYDELLQATFLDMFGDPVTNPNGLGKKKLKEFYIDQKNGTKCGPFGSALKKNEYKETGVPVWTMDNIKPNKFIEGENLFISEEKYNDLKGYETQKGDIIISRAGTVGKMCIIPFTGAAIISTNLIRLRLNSRKLLPIYFTTIMSNWGPKLARLKTGGDNSFTHMNTGVLNEIELPIPPISLQNQFAKIVENLEAQKTLVKQSLQESEDLFNGLVQKAFGGDL